MLLSGGWLGLARGAHFFLIGISLTDCHPDQSFSYPKGMRSGVEGPDVSCVDNNRSGNKNRWHPRARVPRTWGTGKLTRACKEKL